jgi:hypothetical protein
MCLMWSIFDSAEQYSPFLSQKGVVLGAGNTVWEFCQGEVGLAVRTRSVVSRNEGNRLSSLIF